MIISFFRLLLTATVFTSLSLPVLAQEEGQGGTYGYSSIDYDAASNSITAYSETDMDSELLPYYMPRLAYNVTDNHNNTYNNRCTTSTDNSSYYSVTCQFSASPGFTYTIDGEHWVLEQEYYEDQPPGEAPSYLDEVNYQSLPYFDAFGELEYFGPGPAEPSGGPEMQLGSTNDSASVSTPPACDDVRDTVIAEYMTDHSAYRPDCYDFIDPAAWNAAGLISFSTLTPDQSTGQGQFAVLQRYMGQLLVNMQEDLNTVFSISSGYRNPDAEIAAAKQNNVRPALNSRHLAGDAADLRTYSNQNMWINYRNESKKQGACVEPVTYSSFSHAHIDWRTLGNGDFPSTSGGSCPPGW